MNTLLIAPLAVLADALLGEPRRFHPLVGFGRLAVALENRLYGKTGADRAVRGGLALSLMIVPPVLLALLLCSIPGWGWLFEFLLLCFTLGAASLHQHGRAVMEALQAGDLPLARERVGWMVSRDTRALDEQGLAAAACESVLENGNDAIFGALFWFLLLGAPGALLYRLSNTLDAMWGYRNERYHEFGWAAARWDDLLNWLPARLTALSYALLGQRRTALRCWRRQGRRHESPNAGAVMAAGAGALGLALGGPAVYGGRRHERPWFGEGRVPKADDVQRCLVLVRRTLFFWVVLISLGGLALG